MPKTAVAPAEPAGNRVVAVDAYRGFVMLAMASGGLGMTRLLEDERWHALADQFTHRDWVGCTFWDLIQPSFMFLVGVAMVYSYANRQSQGQTWPRQFGHAVVRAGLLILVGVFLDSYGENRLVFGMMRVLQQIAVGYLIAFLVLPLGPAGQGLTAFFLLVGHSAAFFIYGRSHSIDPWDRADNVGVWIDRFLGFSTYRGHYVGFNAVSSAATILFGVLAGHLLKSGLSETRKGSYLFLVGGAGLAFGWALSGGDGWIPLSWSPLIPLVKRIWTASFAIFAAGWTLWMLAAFYLIVEIAKYRAWAFPFIVVGMNSIAMYVMAGVLGANTQRIANLVVPLEKTPGPRVLDLAPRLGIDISELQGSPWMPVWGSLLKLSMLWLICYGMWRKKIFVKL